MSYELEGWNVDFSHEYLSKSINGYSFHIVERDGIYWLRLAEQTIAPCLTLHECQHLAHATARLWAGEE